MTHRALMKPDSIAWEDCNIVRYENNNGIVLMHGSDHRSEVLFFISGEDIGVNPDDTPEDAIECAKPLFKALLDTHNTAVNLSYVKGYKAAQANIRKALGVR